MILVKSIASDTNIAFRKIQDLFSFNLCCFVRPEGFVVNKAKTKGCSFSEYIKLRRYVHRINNSIVEIKGSDFLHTLQF